MESKKPWFSKTVWMALVTALAAFFPGVQAWIAAHPAEFAQGAAVLFTALRFITKDKISIT
jgi:hypothetical protein